MKLTIFYDAHCPLCMSEMRQLKALDTAGRISFVNIHAADFIQRYPHIDPIKAYRILHGELDSGELLLGLDVTCLAWSLVGKHKWLRVFRWPLLRHIADAAYLVFARYRNFIAYMLMGKARCNNCKLNRCSIDS